MTETIVRRPALQNDLYIRSEELPGAPALSDADPEEIERNTDALVHELIVEEKRRVKPTHLPEIVPQEELSADSEPAEDRERLQESIAQILKAERAASAPEAGARSTRRFLPRLRFPSLRLPSFRLPTPPLPKTKRHDQSLEDLHIDETPVDRAPRRLPIPEAVRTYRPTRKHIFLAAFAALMVYRPWLVPLVVLVTFWVVLIAYLTLGPDRWGEILGNAWLRLKAKRPDMAERLRLKADKIAEKWDKVLDRLPESWADHLALPDFSGATQDQGDQPDPFDRLAGEAREV